MHSPCIQRLPHAPHYVFMDFLCFPILSRRESGQGHCNTDTRLMVNLTFNQTQFNSLLDMLFLQLLAIKYFLKSQKSPLKQRY